MDLMNSLIQFSETVGMTPDSVLIVFIRLSAALAVMGGVAFGVIGYVVFRVLVLLFERKKRKP